MKAITFTKEGFEKIKAEFDELTIKRKGAVEELRRARELGDLSENAAYKMARLRLTQTDARLRRLTLLKRIGKINQRPFIGVVDIGTTVIVKIGDREITYQIVGEQEANPSKGMVSIISPIGRALFGKRKGDSVEVVVPAGKILYKIADIVETA